MDSLKLIPQVFFDLIGRVVPGAVAILAALQLSGTTWESWLRASLGEKLAESPSGSMFIYLIGAYVVGQLVSPLAKLVQRAGELPSFKPRAKADGYDWLRTHAPEAGAHCAKIRAEFTMHNGLAAVLLAMAGAYVLSDDAWRWWVLVSLIASGVLAAVRGRTTRDTFHQTVAKFRKEAESPPSKAAKEPVAANGATRT
jgi:hypothetical protein